MRLHGLSRPHRDEGDLAVVGLLQLQGRLDAEFVARVEGPLDPLALEPFAVQLAREVGVGDVFHAYSDVQAEPPSSRRLEESSCLLAIASTLPDRLPP